LLPFSHLHYKPQNNSIITAIPSNIHEFRSSFQIKLKKIIGLTVCSSAGLDVSPTTGVLAYPAG
jgi:hypothetical protein